MYDTAVLCNGLAGLNMFKEQFEVQTEPACCKPVFQNHFCTGKREDKARILIVDDISVEIKMLTEILCQDYEISVTTSGQEAIELAGKISPDLILLDIMMPEMDGYEVCRRLKADSLTQDIPIIFLTAKNGKDDETRGFGMDVVDYITKPFYPNVVKARIRTHLEFKQSCDRLDELVRERAAHLLRVLEQIVHTLKLCVEMKDPYTSGHQERVSQLACAIAEQMGLPEKLVDGIRIAGRLHDIGKLSVPSEILSKPGQLNKNEFGLVKEHSKVSYEILKDIEFPWPIAQIALQHHERTDGSGYPLGLQDEDILPEAKILCVADVVEAMCSHRPYRPAIGTGKALEEIIKNRGILYDPEVVDTCHMLLEKKGFAFTA